MNNQESVTHSHALTQDSAAVQPIIIIGEAQVQAKVEESKTAARPGSKWATGHRTSQKGFEQPKGFFRGAKIK